MSNDVTTLAAELEHALISSLGGISMNVGQLDVAVSLPDHIGGGLARVQITRNGVGVTGTDSLVNLWCGAKPLAVPLILGALAANGVPFDQPLETFAQGPLERLSPFSLRELLSGAIALQKTNLMWARVTDLDEMVALLDEESMERHTPDRSTPECFSEASVQIILDQLLRSLTGCSVVELVASAWSDQTTDVYFGSQPNRPMPQDRFVPYLEPHSNGTVIPMAHDGLADELEHWHYCFGGFASAAGLAGAYEDFGTTKLPWRDSGTYRDELCAPHGEGVGEGGIRLGLMSLDAELLGLRPTTPQLWGHQGWEGRSVGGFDLGTGLGFGILTTDLSAEKSWVSNIASTVIYESKQLIG